MRNTPRKTLEITVQIVLLLASIHFAIQWMKQYLPYRKLKIEHDELVGHVDELPIISPHNFYVEQAATGTSKQFAWRIYLPNDVAISEATCFSGQTRISPHSNLSIDPLFDPIATEQGTQGWLSCKISTDDNSVRIETRSTLNTTGISNSIRSSQIATFVDQHWSDMIVDSLASDGPVDQKPDVPIELLSIRFPSHLIDELDELQDGSLSTLIPNGLLFRLAWGEQESLTQELSDGTGSSK